MSRKFQQVKKIVEVFKYFGLSSRPNMLKSLKQFYSFIISGPKLDERWGRRWRCRRRLRGFRFPPRRSRRRRGRKFGQHSHGSCGTRKVFLRYAGKENLLLSLNITSPLILNIWIEISLFYFSLRKPSLKSQHNIPSDPQYLG